MKLLLDHCVPRRLVRFLSAHDVRTAAEMGLEALRNGKLLQAAFECGFDAVITADQNLKYQQNLTRLPVSVVVLQARTNRPNEIVALAPLIEAALLTLAPRTLVEIKPESGESESGS